MFEDWDTSIAKHADWIRENYSNLDLSDAYIEGVVDEASYGLSLAVKIIQLVVVMLFFGWLGRLVSNLVGAPDEFIVGIAVASLFMPCTYFLWSKSSPLHEWVIRRSIRWRLAPSSSNG